MIIEKHPCARAKGFGKWVEGSNESGGQYSSHQMLKEGCNDDPCSERGEREVVSRSLSVRQSQSSVLRTAKEMSIQLRLHFSMAYRC